MTDLTISQWKAVMEGSVVTSLHFRIAMWNVNKPAYGDWVELVEQAILHQVQLMASRRNYLHELTEDQLTSVIDIALQNLNLDSSAAVVNGNVDVVVRFDNYRWLGEAKIASDVSKIYHGYQQLTSRYATGMEGQTAGGMLLYCQHDDSADAILAGWKAVVEHEVANSNIRPGPNALTFRSNDICLSTGSQLEVVHIAVPLRHDPQEDKKKLSPEAISAARAARKEARKSAG